MLLITHLSGFGVRLPALPRRQAGGEAGTLRNSPPAGDSDSPSRRRGGSSLTHQNQKLEVC